MRAMRGRVDGLLVMAPDVGFGELTESLPTSLPTVLLDGAEASDSLVSSGCVVAGRVERSVLGPGVHVAAGARVTDAVVFADCVIEQGAVVSRAIVDKHSRIGERARGNSTEARLSQSEQAGLGEADAAVAEALAEGNRAYEEKFGQVFLIRAAGRSREEILQALARHEMSADDAAAAIRALGRTPR